ncbi:uncharacterized protein GLRG_03571 [Colletotrichum graminicola M1.001]|uniref:Uncharacterized protein n=1 Tax=Colletotrichum graminicola (strain M1.001 / M2 / FGSC 10212) TaxID=645133 RepID=E3QC39_COLGM|nr:uncharacterized protein GLRG_03571 [Colletotrichum graminicola M1.001]EFQ28427.1 hypothetical protein GLRG_03571 [Colletotrichum graminicola M1.001]
MKMQITIVLSALLAAVAASPVVPVPAELGERACNPLGQDCIAGNNCCSGFCDLPPGRNTGMPVCVTQLTNPRQ